MVRRQNLYTPTPQVNRLFTGPAADFEKALAWMEG
jgi:hypothetical protein